jgi:RNA polymerase sigma-70 factor (ECF subfamily)
MAAIGGNEEVEARISALFEAGDLDGAATTVLKAYGPEVLAFLHALHRTEDDASETFSLFTEGLWRSLRRFDRQCSFRTWAFAIARRTSLRYRRDRGRYRRRHVPIPEGSALALVVDQVRDKTLTYLRTQHRSRLAELRDALPQEDQMLLMLRVDRKVEWKDLATIMAADAGRTLDPVELRREAARLRKRFQLIKDRIHRMAREQGLVGAREDA